METSHFTTAHLKLCHIPVVHHSSQSPSGSPVSVPVERLLAWYNFSGNLGDINQAGRLIQDPLNLVLALDLKVLMFWFRYFTVRDVVGLCENHKISIGIRRKDELTRTLIHHECSEDCASILYVFRCRSSSRKDVLQQFLGVSNVETNAQEPSAVQEQEYEDPNVTQRDATEGAWDAFGALDSDRKAWIIREWQNEMSMENIKRLVCAACSRRTEVALTEWVDGNNIDLSLLVNEAIPEALLPNSYDRHVYSGAILNPKGLELSHSIGKIRLCAECYDSLNKGWMPKYAMSNYLYYGYDALPDNVKTAFKEATLFDRMMICRARANSVVCRFNETGSTTQDTLSRSRKGVRGNIIVSPLDTIRMNDVIPPGQDFIRDTICAVFVSTMMPSMETIAKLRPILVRRSRVKTMIEFLLSQNGHYRADQTFNISVQNMRALIQLDTQDEGIPASVQVGHVVPDGAIQFATSDYVRRNDDSNIGTDTGNEILMENVAYTDGDITPMSYKEMKETAIQRCLECKPFIVAGTGSRIVPDFKNPSLLTWLFPHLDPWGIGGFHHPDRKITLNMEDQVAYLLKLDESPFERDPEFAFVFYNIIRKAQVSSTLRFMVPYKTHERVLADLVNVAPDVLSRLNTICREDPSYRPRTEEERHAFRLLSSLKMVTRRVPCSDGYKVMRRHELRALTQQEGTPNLFITLSPSDVDHPLVRIMAGEDIDLEDMTRGEDMDEWSRKLYAAKHPAACALFFDLMIKKFIDLILRYGQCDLGVYGRCRAYFGTVEAQGKGSLHCHMLIWLDGHLSPHSLREWMKKSSENKDRVFQWLESIIQCEFPGDMNAKQSLKAHPERVRPGSQGNPNPGAIPLPAIRLYEDNRDEYWRQYNYFLTQLLFQYNWHEHQATCWKYLKRGQEKNDQNCRLGMDGVTREHSFLDEESSAICLKRVHPKISSYTDLVTFLMQCNMNIQFVGSGDRAKAFIYYVTDYITKPSLPVYVGMGVLSYVVKRNHENSPVSQSEGGQAVKAVINAVNSMMARHEISHPQVMSYLIGGGDLYTSHKFAIMSWGAIKRYADIAYAIESNGDSRRGPTELDPVEYTATVDLNHESITAGNQQLDYMFRSGFPEYDGICLYDFVALLCKRSLSRAQRESGRGQGRFLCRHPQFETHYLTFRQHRMIPVLLGAMIPNPSKSEETRELWAADMLLLFKPWRTPLDLRKHGQSWYDTYQEYETNIKTTHKNIIKNMIVLLECGEARDKYTPRGQRDLRTPTAEVIIGHCHDVPDEYLNAAIDSMYGEAGVEGEREGHAVHSAENRLSNLLGFDVASLLDHCLPDIDDGSRTESEIDAPMTAEYRETLAQYSSIMSLKRKRRVIAQEDGHDHDRPRTRTRNQSDDPFVKPMVILQDQRKVEYTEYAFRAAGTIIEEMNLRGNSEQLLAFNLVAKQIITKPPKQFLMHVSGVGGTGKSHVIKAIVKLFQKLGRRRELLLGAPTGIAATLIGGQTLHSLILTSPQRKGYEAGHEDLVSVWKYVQFLIIDEVSMVGAVFLSEISLRIRQGKGDNTIDRNKPFGGINVVFMGDFGQLDPPRQKSLYAYQMVVQPSQAESRSRYGVSAMNGAFLWRQVDRVVELKKNVRQSEDRHYAEFLNRLRLKKCTRKKAVDDTDDLDYINTRLLSNVDRIHEGELEAFYDAPIIVGSKALRDALNDHLVNYHARRQGREVFEYYSRDTIQRSSPVSDLQKLLWEIPSNIHSDSFGKLAIFSGMRVMVTENLAFEHGVVNGSEGIVVDIKYEEEMGRRYAAVAFVLISGCGISVPGLPIDIVPIVPTSCSVPCGHLHGRYPSLTAKTFTRRQLPLVPAYSFTDYKSQGRTFTRIIVDLESAQGQGIYVMLSRVKSLQGLLILRWFSPTKIYGNMSQQLRNELSRLKDLELRTVEAWREEQKSNLN